GAPLGLHRMRIGTADSGQATPNPCYSGSWGVTFDFVIDIAPAPSCFPPTEVTAVATSSQEISFSWTASESTPEGYDWEVRTSGEPESGTDGLVANGTVLGDVTGSASGLTPNTTYYVYVRSSCSND